jgi:hypothetical protein
VKLKRFGCASRIPRPEIAIDKRGRDRPNRSPTLPDAASRAQSFSRARFTPKDRRGDASFLPQIACAHGGTRLKPRNFPARKPKPAAHALVHFREFVADLRSLL